MTDRYARLLTDGLTDADGAQLPNGVVVAVGQILAELVSRSGSEPERGTHADRLAQLDARLANLETRIRHFEITEDRAAREEEQRERALSREIERKRRRE